MPRGRWSRRRARGPASSSTSATATAFPVPHGRASNPATEDGMGLNTTLGLSDSDKKYYGETSIANEIRFAPNAIVFLNHLCYAPGAGEPGAPEPTVTTAKQRVDNYASGFIRAGAEAVIADDYTSTVPDMIRAIFSTHQSILASWRTVWGYHGNEIPFVPARNPAFQAILDPDTWTSGFK